MANFVAINKKNITCPFGVKDRLHPNGHRGVDVVRWNGKSYTSGVVAKVAKSVALGNVVIVKDTKQDYWGYCHLAKVSVKNADVVKAGKTKIGKQGATGTAADGSHLHLTCGGDIDAVFIGKVKDPVATLEKRIAQEKEAKNV